MTTRNYDASIVWKVRESLPPQIYRGEQNGAIYDFARGIVPFVNPPYPSPVVPPTPPPTPGSFIWVMQNLYVYGGGAPSITTTIKCDTTGNFYRYEQGSSDLFIFGTENNRLVVGSSILISPILQFLIIKFNSDGTFIWAARNGMGSSTGVLNTFSNIFNNNLCISNIFRTNVSTFHSNSQVASTFAGVNTVATGIFVAKYNTSGFNIWLLRLSGANITGNEVTFPTITNSDNDIIYVSGQYRSTFSTFNANNHLTVISTLSTTTSGVTSDIFLARYSSIGTNDWLARIAGSNDDLNPFIIADTSDNVYISGQYKLNISTFNAGSQFVPISTLTGFSSALNDLFVAKYNSNGTNAWLVKIGGTSDRINPVVEYNKTDSVIYITGVFRGNMSTFNADGSLASTLHNAKGGALHDIFIAKYLPDGTNKWLVKIGGTNNSAIPILGSDNFGNIYITGNFVTNISTFNIDSEVIPISTLVRDNTSGFVSDFFIAKYNNTGHNVWLTKIGTSNTSGSSSSQLSVTCDNLGHIYLACPYFSDIRFYDAQVLTPAITLERYSFGSMFVAKMLA